MFRGGAWSVEKVFGLVGVRYWHAQMFRLTAFLGQMMSAAPQGSRGVDVRRPVFDVWELSSIFDENNERDLKNLTQS